MIRAVISENAEGAVTGFCISGHAGFAESGSDIICSAVSAIAYTALGYMDEALSEIDGSHVAYEENEGCLKWDRSSLNALTGKNGVNVFNVKLDAVLKAMVIGLVQIRESYGTKYLSIQFEEVLSQC